MKPKVVHCAGYKWEYVSHGRWRTADEGLPDHMTGRFWVYCFGPCWHWQRGGAKEETWRGCHKTMRAAMTAVVRFAKRNKA